MASPVVLIVSGLVPGLYFRSTQNLSALLLASSFERS
jgi:hypothetical protein